MAQPRQLSSQLFRSFLALTLLAWGTTAHADDALRLSPDRLEVNALPLILGDTDRGVVVGAAAVLVRFREGTHPYAWRISLLAQTSVQRQSDDQLVYPYHNDVIRVELPGVFHPKVRLDLELAFRRYSQSGYYGLGNDASNDEKSIPNYHHYDRIHPSLKAQGRFQFADRVQLLAGLGLTYNWINLYENSELVTDAGGSDPDVKDLLHGLRNHAQAELTLGALYDSRDHEFWPTRGMLHELSLRLSPGLENLYGGVNLTGRFFLPLWHQDRLVLGGRLTVDMLFGDAPIYELSRVGGLNPHDAPGGGMGIRGVPLQRYYGKIKILANIELRSRVASFTLSGQRFALGGLLFVDTGRIWSGFSAPVHLDGDGLGLKVGLGGGARLQWGETFILRFDLAWSPDAKPIGFYAGLNHLF